MGGGGAPFPINYTRGAVIALVGFAKTRISPHSQSVSPPPPTAEPENAKISKCERFDTYILTDLRMAVSEVTFPANMLYWLPIHINLLVILI